MLFGVVNFGHGLNLVQKIDLISILHTRDPVGVGVQKHLCGVTELLGRKCGLDSGHEHFGCPGVPADVSPALSHAALLECLFRRLVEIICVEAGSIELVAEHEAPGKSPGVVL